MSSVGADDRPVVSVCSRFKLRVWVHSGRIADSAEERYVTGAVCIRVTALEVKVMISGIGLDPRRLLGACEDGRNEVSGRDTASVEL